MDIKLDLDGLVSVQKRWKRHNPYNEDYGTMDAKTTEAVLIMAKDDVLLYRALSAYFADKAKDAEEILAGYVAEHHFGIPHKDVPFLQPGADSRVRGEIPIEGGPIELWGEVDATKKMSIITVTVNRQMSTSTDHRTDPPTKKEVWKEKVLAKYRYNPKADKLSRIG